MKERLFGGIDIGSTTTKAVILDTNKELRGYSINRSGTDFLKSAQKSWNEAINMAGISPEEIDYIISTGYGRHNVDFVNDSKTEISCHARGCYHFFQEAITIVDIGGQDNKVIRLGEKGERLSFRMNRKCAAGTGAFLEEMSLRLDIPIEKFDKLARESKKRVELGSFCTVFTATEILSKIRAGEKVPDLVRGIFLSIIKRVMEMDTLEGKVVLTGGVVAHNPILRDMFKEELPFGSEVLVPPHPQLTGAIGAAILAIEEA